MILRRIRKNCNFLLIGIVKIRVYMVQMMVYRKNGNMSKITLNLRPRLAPAAGKPALAAWTSQCRSKRLAPAYTNFK